MTEYKEFIVRVRNADLIAGSPFDTPYLHGEIVRCRDCAKWHHIDTLDGVRYGECDEWKRADSYCVPATRESGFCAWGERVESFTTCKCGEDIETNGRESVTCPNCGRVITE